ncbi:hypothetical protein XENORESO_017564 [Xenotaenia resolanae]|uniref:Uncharacterized protein n=1 Tax=Xenotaenia resolanae TaxID=208358 RepID=A0ABV0WS77_9TELE
MRGEIEVEPLLLHIERSQLKDYFSCLAWGRLGIPQNELEGVSGERMLVSLLDLLRLQPVLYKQRTMGGWMYGGLPGAENTRIEYFLTSLCLVLFYCGYYVSDNLLVLLFPLVLPYSRLSGPAAGVGLYRLHL